MSISLSKIAAKSRKGETIEIDRRTHGKNRNDGNEYKKYENKNESKSENKKKNILMYFILLNFFIIIKFVRYIFHSFTVILPIECTRRRYVFGIADVYARENGQEVCVETRDSAPSDPQRPPVSTDRRSGGARRSRKKMTGPALHYRSVTPFNYLGHKL